jgi:acetolactate synthase-1/2/3 large subunit
MTEHRNGGAAVVETLAAHGVDTIFGIPGTHNLELYRHFPTTGIRAMSRVPDTPPRRMPESPDGRVSW